MKQVTATGSSVEDAVRSALKELNTTRDRVEIKVIDEGKKGIFGFGSRPAIIKATLKIDPIEEGVTFLKQVCEKMGAPVHIEVQKEVDYLKFNLSGEKIALLIGKRGETLNSLQYLTQLVINRYAERYYRLLLDAENYRERRKETLTNLAKKLSQKAIKTGQKISLEPMPSYERKIIHSALMDNELVKTYSEGVEPNRHIIICPIAKEVHNKFEK